MKGLKQRIIWIAGLVMLIVACTPFMAFAAEEAAPQAALYGTFWSLAPPVIAIGLALITKEVYSSLFIGIVIGGIVRRNYS